jgi:menaquinone-dependent protoporphyrinogen oxidase
MRFPRSDDVGSKILVAYASHGGATAEVASEMAAALRDRGLVVDVRSVDEEPLVEGYRAILIGSGVRHGTWLPEAIEFVAKNQQRLAHIPVTAFCVHSEDLADDPLSRERRRGYLDAVRLLVRPVEEAFFSGRFDRRTAGHLAPQWVMRLTSGAHQRRRKEVRAWARKWRTLR